MPTEEMLTTNTTTPEENAQRFAMLSNLASSVTSQLQQGREKRSTRRSTRRSSRPSRRSSRRQNIQTGLETGLQTFTSSQSTGQQDPFAPFGPLYLIDSKGRSRPMRPFGAIPHIQKRLPGNKPKWPVRTSTKFSSLIQQENKAIMPIVARARPGTQIQSAIVQDQKKKESNTTLIVASVGIPIALIGGFFGYRHFFGDKSTGSQNYNY